MDLLFCCRSRRNESANNDGEKTTLLDKEDVEHKLQDIEDDEDNENREQDLLSEEDPNEKRNLLKKITDVEAIVAKELQRLQINSVESENEGGESQGHLPDEKQKLPLQEVEQENSLCQDANAKGDFEETAPESRAEESGAGADQVTLSTPLFSRGLAFNVTGTTGEPQQQQQLSGGRSGNRSTSPYSGGGEDIKNKDEESTITDARADEKALDNVALNAEQREAKRPLDSEADLVLPGEMAEKLLLAQGSKDSEVMGECKVEFEEGATGATSLKTGTTSDGGSAIQLISTSLESQDKECSSDMSLRWYEEESEQAPEIVFPCLKEMIEAPTALATAFEGRWSSGHAVADCARDGVDETEREVR